MTMLEQSGGTPATAPNDVEGRVVPFFVVGDESGSMTGAPVDAINGQLAPLHAAVTSEPVVSDRVRFGIIAFSDAAQEILPLSDLWNVTAMPALSANGTTNYHAAFTLLRDRIQAGVTDLAGEGLQVLRPMVMFFSDGHPNGPDWKPAYRDLVDPGFRARPNVITFGFGSADADVLRQIATVAHYQADQGTSPADALRQFAATLTRSIVASANAIAQGQTQMPVPATPPGYTQMAPIPMDQVA